MHELGVAFHIADSVTRIAAENDAAHVRAVTLEIGEVSTVVPEYLVDVWSWNCKRTPMLEGCELLIERIRAIQERIPPRDLHAQEDEAAFTEAAEQYESQTAIDPRRRRMARK